MIGLLLFLTLFKIIHMSAYGTLMPYFYFTIINDPGQKCKVKK